MFGKEKPILKLTVWFPLALIVITHGIRSPTPCLFLLYPDYLFYIYIFWDIFVGSVSHHRKCCDHTIHFFLSLLKNTSLFFFFGIYIKHVIRKSSSLEISAPDEAHPIRFCLQAQGKLICSLRGSHTWVVQALRFHFCTCVFVSEYFRGLFCESI